MRKTMPIKPHHDPAHLYFVTATIKAIHHRDAEHAETIRVDSWTIGEDLDQLQRDGRTDLLAFFAQRQDADASKGHQIWLPMEARNVYSVEFLRQKVEYSHNNPVAKHWHLVDERADYRYSSACFYDRGEPPIIAVDDVREWMV